MRRMQLPERFFNLPDFVPDLQEIMTDPAYDQNRQLRVAMAVSKEFSEEERLQPEIHDRHQITFTDGENLWDWKVDSIQSLFRGDQQPPVIGDHPEVYNDAFILIDLHLLEVSSVIGVRRDLELREIFSSLRRRPDGRSSGFLHDYLWQAVALILGTRVLSRAEFEAIMARMERSCRTFERGPTSHNLLNAIHKTFGGA